MDDGKNGKDRSPSFGEGQPACRGQGEDFEGVLGELLGLVTGYKIPVKLPWPSGGVLIGMKEKSIFEIARYKNRILYKFHRDRQIPF
ncbi:MAG TPA: hypothetical protein VLZ54_12110 [Arenibacter sp.]|nr:hypothetical protein [Arenibacter sp.]